MCTQLLQLAFRGVTHCKQAGLLQQTGTDWVYEDRQGSWREWTSLDAQAEKSFGELTDLRRACTADAD